MVSFNAPPVQEFATEAVAVGIINRLLPRNPPHPRNKLRELIHSGGTSRIF